MATAAEHFTLYRSLRNHILARHFALGRWHRANLLTLVSHLQPLPAEWANLPSAERELLRRWNVADHEHENPLMMTAHLHVMLALETLSGSPQAVGILRRSLETVASLIPLNGTKSGWITRWDAASTDHWELDAHGEPVRCLDFLTDDAGNYQTCIPATDPRHVPLRSRETMLALRTRADADAVRNAEGDGFFWGYVDRRRRWEASADELSGLLGGWAFVDRFVPALRSLVRPQASALIRRLAGNGYVQVRPCGGLVGRGASGALLAFERPVDHWARSIGMAAGASAMVDLEGALRLAGYGTVLEGPIGAWRAAAWAGTLVLGPFLAQVGGLAAALGGLISGAGVVIGPATLGLMQALYTHRDVFDVMNDGETLEPIIGALLDSLEPQARWEWYLRFVGTQPGNKALAGNFAPLLALMSIDDATSPCAAQYVAIIRARRAGRAPSNMADVGLDSALATAVAVMLGAADLAPVLMQQLDARYDLFVAAGHDAPITSSDGQYSLELQSVWLALDYLAALSLGWLHASRTAGAPAGMAPAPESDWRAIPEPVVPAVVLRHLPEVRKAASAPDPAGTSDWPLFSGPGDVVKPVIRSTQALPPVLTGPDWEYTYRVGRWMRDVPTGLVFGREHDFQIETSGVVDGLGPDGADPVDDARWPLHRGLDPQARAGSLLVYLGGYLHAGEFRPRQRFLTWEPKKMFLRINRPEPDRQSTEFFEVTVRAWGPRPWPVPPGFVVEFVEWEIGNTSRRKNVRLRIGAIGGTHGSGERWMIEVHEAVALIRDYDWRFHVRTANGPRLTVAGRRSGRPYLRTVGDGARSNNLKNLPDA